VKPVAAIPQIRELNIGHFLIGEAVFIGLEQSIRTMRRLMDEARSAGENSPPTERSGGPLGAANAASLSERPEEAGK
jgi:hypothetical protein